MKRQSADAVDLKKGARRHAIESLEQRRLLSTATISAGTLVPNATTNPAKALGVNLVYWDDQMNTTQTQQMVQAAGLNEFRFPGGSASDDFHFNVAANWGDSGANTIPQFAQFIQAAGGTGVVTLDYGSGSPQEAEAELAYLVGSTADIATTIGNGLEWNDSTSAWQTVNWQSVSYWASLRAATPLATDDGLNFLRVNHPAPFAGINSWEIGNEEYGSWEVDHHGTAGPNGSTGAQHDPATYAAFAASFATFVTADHTNLPSISIGIDSDDPTGSDYNDWTRYVLTDCLADGFVPGFISDHNYMQEPGDENDSTLLKDTVSDSASILDWTTRYTDYQTLLQQTLGTTNASKVQIIATEFNSVSYNPGKQTTSLVNGLFIADSLGSLLDSGYSGGYVWDIRNDYDNSENNSASLYGWREAGDYGLLGDPNTTDPPYTGAYIPYPSYFAEQLVSKMALAGGQVVSATVNTTGASVYAVKEANGHLDLLVINKSSSASLTNQFNISGFQPNSTAQFWQYGETQDTAQSHTTNGASALANFSATLSLTGSNFSYTFPAYSMTVIDLSQSVILSGSNYLELDGTISNQLDVWAGTTNTGTPTTTYQLSQISSITDTGTTGGSTLTVDFTHGNPLASIGMNYIGQGSSAIDKLSVIGSRGNDTIVATSSQLSIDGTPITYSDVGQVIFTTGSGVDSLTVNSGALILGTPAKIAGAFVEKFSTILIGAGASLSMTPPSSGHTVLIAGGLTLASSAGVWTAKLDITNNDLDITGGVMSTVINQITQGYNGGNWLGLGITSSSAAANGSYLTGLGIIQNNQAGLPIFNSTNELDNTIPGTSDVLVKYTYYGDANLDGMVDGGDYSLIDNGFHNQLTGWLNGDFNYDGVVDGSDYTLIDNAFNEQSVSLTASIASSIFSSATVAAGINPDRSIFAPPGPFQTQNPIAIDPPPTSEDILLLQQKTDVLDRLSTE